jgi:hypothetical protein
MTDAAALVAADDGPGIIAGSLFDAGASLDRQASHGAYRALCRTPVHGQSSP